jgi:hypothetical protein
MRRERPRRTRHRLRQRSLSALESERHDRSALTVRHACSSSQASVLRGAGQTPARAHCESAEGVSEGPPSWAWTGSRHSESAPFVDLGHSVGTSRGPRPPGARSGVACSHGPDGPVELLPMAGVRRGLGGPWPAAGSLADLVERLARQARRPTAIRSAGWISKRKPHSRSQASRTCSSPRRSMSSSTTMASGARRSASAGSAG